MVIFSCPTCHDTHHVDISLAGTMIACPSCDADHHVPRIADQVANSTEQATAEYACSRAVYVIVALTLGTLGFHNFIAHRYGSAITQLMWTLLVGWILFPLALSPVLVWVIIEILSVTKDGDGNRMP